MIKPKIVVRSYKRPDMITKKTLGELRKQKDIDLGSDLILVLANKDEYDSYIPYLKDFPIKDILISGNGHEGGHIAHNAAIDYLPEGEPVVFMDDDLSSFKVSTQIEDLSSKKPLEELGVIQSYIFERIGETDLWGMYFTSNILFKKSSPWFEFRQRLVGGSWWGCYNSDMWKVNQGHEDDIIRTSRALELNGEAYFLNWVHANTCNWSTRGGMQADNERGVGELRLERTKALSIKAWEETPAMQKFYRQELVLSSDGSTYHRKMKSAKELEKLLSCKRRKWSGYMQMDEDVVEINHTQLDF